MSTNFTVGSFSVSGHSLEGQRQKFLERLLQQRSDEIAWRKQAYLEQASIREKAVSPLREFFARHPELAVDPTTRLESQRAAILSTMRIAKAHPQSQFQIASASGLESWAGVSTTKSDGAFDQASADPNTGNFNVISQVDNGTHHQEATFFTGSLRLSSPGTHSCQAQFSYNYSWSDTAGGCCEFGAAHSQGHLSFTIYAVVGDEWAPIASAPKNVWYDDHTAFSSGHGGEQNVVYSPELTFNVPATTGLLIQLIAYVWVDVDAGGGALAVGSIEGRVLWSIT
jgi:hypothetical protein